MRLNQILRQAENGSGNDRSVKGCDLCALYGHALAIVTQSLFQARDESGHMPFARGAKRTCCGCLELWRAIMPDNFAGCANAILPSVSMGRSFFCQRVMEQFAEHRITGPCGIIVRSDCARFAGAADRDQGLAPLLLCAVAVDGDGLRCNSASHGVIQACAGVD